MARRKQHVMTTRYTRSPIHFSCKKDPIPALYLFIFFITAAAYLAQLAGPFHYIGVEVVPNPTRTENE